MYSITIHCEVQSQIGLKSQMICIFIKHTFTDAYPPHEPSSDLFCD